MRFGFNKPSLRLVGVSAALGLVLTAQDAAKGMISEVNLNLG
jgi:hypothetical protein